MRVINGIVKKIEDPKDESGMSKLPQRFKDLIYILRVEYQFSLGENNVDHLQFISQYKDIIGVKIDYPDITEDEHKDLAIKYVCYRQAIYCYEHLIKERPYENLSKDQQKEYDLFIKRENEIVSRLFQIEDFENLTEEMKNAYDITMTYFTSYSGNKFILPSKEYYPR